jgi:hypothetical protein
MEAVILLSCLFSFIICADLSDKETGYDNNYNDINIKN